MSLAFPRKSTQYIFFEMWPSLIMGVIVFVFIMMMFQALRYTEFVLIHGVGVRVIFQLMSFLAISFLPALFPMAVLFSVLMTYGRMSQDSEIVALKASGYHMSAILLPAVLLSLIVAVISAQTSFHLAPWGNRQFEVLVTQLGQTKASATLREGTFSEGFFNLVVYASEVESKSGQLKNVFIFDERDPETPLTIISRRGQILQEQGLQGHSALLRLFDGDIHRKGQTHTKIKFNSFDIFLSDPVKEETRAKSPPSLTIEEIRQRLANPDLPSDDRTTLETEFHKRWAVAIVCIIFAVLGVGLGTTTNRRTQKSGVVVTCMAVIIAYWIIYITAEGLARTGSLPAALSIWTPNTLFGIFAVWILRKNWNH